jgi:hypothetical protein
MKRVDVLIQQALFQGRPYSSEIKLILTLRKECRLRVFGNRILKELFGAKGQEVAGWSRKILNEKFHSLY